MMKQMLRTQRQDSPKKYQDRKRKALFKNRGNTTSWAQKANYPTFYLGITLNTWTLVSYPCVHTKAQDCIEPRVFPVKAKFLP